MWGVIFELFIGCVRYCGDYHSMFSGHRNCMGRHGRWRLKSVGERISLFLYSEWDFVKVNKLFLKRPFHGEPAARGCSAVEGIEMNECTEFFSLGIPFGCQIGLLAVVESLCICWSCVWCRGVKCWSAGVQPIKCEHCEHREEQEYASRGCCKRTVMDWWTLCVNCLCVPLSSLVLGCGKHAKANE